MAEDTIRSKFEIANFYKKTSFPATIMATVIHRTDTATIIRITAITITDVVITMEIMVDTITEAGTRAAVALQLLSRKSLSSNELFFDL
jgi:hypothetical protein